MLTKFDISGGNNKTLNRVYKEMIKGHKNKSVYDGIYNTFIKDILGYKNIKDLTSNDIDYFYIYLTRKTYNGHLYSHLLHLDNFRSQNLQMKISELYLAFYFLLVKMFVLAI